MKRPRFLIIAIAFISLAINLPAHAQVAYDEATDGELSGDNTMPTDLGVFSPGSNSISGTVVDALGGSPNVDVFTFEVAPGTQLDGIFLDNFVSDDDAAFIGIDDSTSFPFNSTELGSGPDQSQFIGGLLFGGSVGTNIISNIGSGSIGTGFSSPLAAGDYTVYLQQLGGTPVDYTFSFNVVPEPSTFAIFGVSIGLLAVMFRRR